MAKHFDLMKNEDPNVYQFCPYKNRVEITQSGTWTVPAGVEKIDAFLVGGGGGGCYYDSSTTRFSGGSGYTRLYRNIEVTPGSTVNIVIGAAGKSANLNKSEQSTSGGTTSITANRKTFSVYGGAASTSPTSLGNGGSGGGLISSDNSYKGYAGFNGGGGFYFQSTREHPPAYISTGQGYPTIDPYSGIMYSICVSSNGPSSNYGGSYYYSGEQGVCIIYY